MNAILSQMIFIVPLILIIVWMFVSQRKRSKQVKEMIASIQEGVYVKTIGGFYGKVVGVKEDVITIECGPDKARLVIDKNAVSTVENNDIVSAETLEKK